MEPSIEQLKTVNANGADNAINLLVLKTNGKFELKVISGQSPAQTNFKDVVARYETFAPGTGYVGNAASEDEHLIRNAFNSLMECWEVYKKNGVLDQDIWD